MPNAFNNTDDITRLKQSKIKTYILWDTVYINGAVIVGISPVPIELNMETRMSWQNVVYAPQLNAHKGLSDGMRCVPKTMVRFLQWCVCNPVYIPREILQNTDK